ncbi:HD domain-containing protein [Fundidesulfovibrio terrae]|uniref:HD domain-containing protein n=1 Tax=Fundidesulfovibrio terrae TaxID=2922866 RepID=UPI001FAF59E4|nr:HD domain-containing protein [Fundidesulfovibrio terrae]
MGDDPISTVDMTGRDRLTRMADFLFEVSMLRRTPRTGYQFLGSGSENVAEHSFGTAMIGYTLARMAGADEGKTVLLCLFHDVHEARTGDFNYVAKLYNTHDSRRALADGLKGTGMSGPVLKLHDELEEALSLEARLAQDADQLDLMVNLKELLDLGNPYARKWMDCAVERLRTPQGRELAKAIMTTDHTDWWFLGPDACWWERKNGKE